MNKMKQNNYDNLYVDVNELFDKNLKLPHKKQKNFISKLITRYFSAILLKLGLYEIFVEVGLFKKWFSEFKSYWLHVLGGRYIYLHDFYFLLGLYRTRFQDVETPDHASNKDLVSSNKDIREITALKFKAICDGVAGRHYRSHGTKKRRPRLYI